MKPSGIGGMAVMEGVMMKNKDTYAVAVRKPDNEIAVEVNTHHDFSDKVKLFKLPIFRGMLAFVDSLVVGIKVLNYSASFFEEEEEKESKDKKEKKSKAVKEDTKIEEAKDSENISIAEEAATKDLKKEDKTNALLMAFAVLISIVMSIALFMVLPVLITTLFSSFVTNQIIINLIEGIVRLSIFIGYVILASRMNEIKRVFMYHGAEHKTINCLENGYELTIENVRRQSKQHKRCGTSFMLLVILISLIFFMFLPSMNLLGRVLSRVILVPFIAGISYEFIRLAGKSENKVVTVLSQPGLWMQGLTTKEPDDSMIEVAIKSVEAVFDWKAFLKNSGNKRNLELKKDSKKLQTQPDKKNDASAKTQVGKQNSASNKQAEKQTNSSNIKNTAPETAALKQDNKKQNSEKQNSDKQNSEVQNSVKQDSVISGTDKQKVEKQTISADHREDKNSISSGKEAVGKSNTSDKKKESKISATEVRPQVGGLAYTGKVPAVDKTGSQDMKSTEPKQQDGKIIGRNKGAAPVTLRPDLSINTEDEDDDILKALDKFFDNGHEEKD